MINKCAGNFFNSPYRNYQNYLPPDFLESFRNKESKIAGLERIVVRSKKK